MSHFPVQGNQAQHVVSLSTKHAADTPEYGVIATVSNMKDWQDNNNDD